METALKILLNVIVETVQEAGSEGAPSGVIYAALLTVVPNLSASDFNLMLDVLVKGSMIRRGPCHLLFTA